MTAECTSSHPIIRSRYPKGNCPVIRVGERVIGDSKSIVAFADKKLRCKDITSILCSSSEAQTLGSSNIVGTIWNLCGSHFKAQKGGNDAEEEQQKAEKEREQLKGLLQTLCES